MIVQKGREKERGLGAMAKFNEASSNHRHKRPLTSYLKSKDNLYKNKRANFLYETYVKPY